MNRRISKIVRATAWKRDFPTDGDSPSARPRKMMSEDAKFALGF